MRTPTIESRSAASDPNASIPLPQRFHEQRTHEDRTQDERVLHARPKGVDRIECGLLKIRH